MFFNWGFFTKKKNNIIKINTKPDKEHNKILNLVDKLYNECYKHLKTEERMYKKGLRLRHAEHKDTSEDWKEHTEHHQELLNQIQTLKKNIINHIETDDIRDFHWAHYLDHR